MGSLDQRFDEWLRIVIPSFSVEERNTRLVAIQLFAEDLTMADIIPLVLLFLGATYRGAVPDRLRETLTKSDPSFVPTNEAELAIIAGGVLFELCERGGLRAGAASLALASGEFGGLRGAARLQDVIDRGAHYLASEGLRLREEKIDFPDLGALLKAAVEEGDEGEENSAGADENKTQLGRVVEALATYGCLLRTTLRAVEDRRVEESSILYWLLSGRRRTNAQLLGELKRRDIVFSIAFELAEQTKQIPGPSSSSAILRALLEQCKDGAKESNVNMCVSALSPADGELFLSQLHSYDPRIMPLTFALEKARENGWKKGWQTAFETQSKMQAGAARTLLQITEQFYREVLLARLLEKD